MKIIVALTVDQANYAASIISEDIWTSDFKPSEPEHKFAMRIVKKLRKAVEAAPKS